MKQRLFLHIDMDAFFAAIEQRDDPNLKGKPVIIGPDPKKGQLRGVVSTCSYEARKFGIHSAMPISEAYRLCPDGIYVWGHMSAYAYESSEIMKIFEKYTDRIEKISIDEAFLEVSDILHLYDDDPVKLAFSIQNRVKLERDLTCSIGVSYKKFLSKIGSDFNKPNGITYIGPDEELTFLDKLPIQKLWGVGKKSAERFKKLNILTVGDIKKHTYDENIKLFGKMGDHFWKLAHAIDTRDISASRERKSCSKEHTFFEDMKDVDKIEQKIFQLSEEVLELVRSKNYRVKNLHIKLRFSDFTTLTRQMPYSNIHLDQDKVFQSCIKLYKKENPNNEAVRLIGMGFDLSIDDTNQIDLFDQESSKTDLLNKTKDKINEKFGKNMIKGAEGLK